jgi:putative ABC transport system permease protein
MTFIQDLRYGARELRRYPGFALTAIVSLALGIMAATAMYSVIYGVVLEPFPYRDVNNLVSIVLTAPGQRGYNGSYTPADYAELSRRATVFTGIAGSTISDVLWKSDGEPRRLRGNHITNNGFDVMGVPALFGRTVTAGEEHPETKAVLGYRFWIGQFGGNRAVIGSTLILNGRPRTIVGVMPPRFMFRGADVYLPLSYRAGEPTEGVTSIWVTARRKPGVTDAQAQADLDPIFRDLAQRTPTSYPKGWRVQLMTFKETFPSGIRAILLIMFGAVGLLLLIACANVSNLLLARASARQREMAMRSALGAGRSRIFRQLLTESLVLGLAGSLLGVIGSWAGLKAILAVVPPNVIPDEAEIALNFPVLAFSFVLCLTTTVLFGLAPALHGASGRLAAVLKEGGRGSGSSRRMRWLRGSLVVVELSLAIILLAGAGLFLHTLARLYSAPLAGRIDHRLTLRLPLSADRYPTAERRSTFIREVLDRISALPGVRAVGINAGLHPLGSWTVPIEIPGSSTPDTRAVNLHQVNRAYLAATNIHLRSGRWFEESDIGARRFIALVNETFAARYFNGQSPLGKIVKIPRLRNPPFKLLADQFELIGTVEDAMHELHNGDARPELYIPYSITGMADTLVVHTAGDPMNMAPYIRSQIFAIDPAQPIDETRTLEELLDRYVYSGGRFRVWLMGVFAVLGLTLSVIGVYGLLSQMVAMEQRSIGIRMAVGADSRDIIRFVLGGGARLILTGLGVGIVATLLLLRRYGLALGVTDPFQPEALIGAALLLAAAGFIACLIPALRAGRTDPVLALRAE